MIAPAAIAWAVLAAVALQRLLELPYAARNTRRLLARGGVEHGAGHYPFLVVLHVAWLVAMAAFLPDPVRIYWAWIGVYLVLQILRAWTLMALGEYWTTRIITMPGQPLVRRGPYRVLRHPNYLIVVCEIVVLPLAFGEGWIALVFTVLNAAMLAWRIRIEDRALAPRRTAAGEQTP